MKVLIAGGTGFVGRALTAELAARGHEVTALSRSPDDRNLPDGVSTVAADVTDPDGVREAVAGTEAVVNLVALSPLFEPAGGNVMHERVHLDGTRNLVSAAESADVDRYLQMSALGADPDGSTHYVRSKGRAERLVRDSDLSWTIVRPSVVFGEGGEFVSFTKTLTTPYVTGLPGGGKSRFQPVWIGDLAPILADCLDDAGHVGESYELGGPEVLTLAEVARLASRAEGRPLLVLPIPMPLAGVGLAIAGVIPGIPMGLDQYRSLRFDNTVGENDVTAFDRSPADLRTLADYLGDGANDGGVRDSGASGRDASDPGNGDGTPS